MSSCIAFSRYFPKIIPRIMKITGCGVAEKFSMKVFGTVSRFSKPRELLLVQLISSRMVIQNWKL